MDDETQNHIIKYFHESGSELDAPSPANGGDGDEPTTDNTAANSNRVRSAGTLRLDVDESSLNKEYIIWL